MNQKNITVFQMFKVISIHEYILKPGVGERGFLKAILDIDSFENLR